MRLIDLTGKTFGRLEVLNKHGYVGNDVTWLCKCSCGNTKVVSGKHLREGRIVSCGCYRREHASEMVKGKNNPMYGLPREKNPMMRPEVRAKVSAALKGKNNPMYGRTGDKNPMWGKRGPESTCWGRTGDKHPLWKGGISFDPYCSKFNLAVKEDVRENFDRRCFICGLPESENGRKLCVHHVDYQKSQGCKGKKWSLIPLCDNCHSKTNFDRWHWFSLLICYWIKEEWLDGLRMV